jgi:hypothetical protein
VVRALDGSLLRVREELERPVLYVCLLMGYMTHGGAYFRGGAQGDAHVQSAARQLRIGHGRTPAVLSQRLGPLGARSV